LFYDATFGRLVKRRIERAINHMNIRPDDVILDLGIGTGVSLNYYPLDRGRVVGVDLSAGMLRRGAEENPRARPVARGRFSGQRAPASVRRQHLRPRVHQPRDQRRERPVQLVQEAQRVAKPGARIVIVNHFQSTNRFIALFEKWLCPLCTSSAGGATWRSRT
jgi:phosphatidylethanolamine/phosphatidyl-N-methylethanolamine N-methyltransferase